ncbi:MAG: LLM class flavin-dependent oxidoreductase, partial [Polaromonas sp.]|nr:LLM class flavin-dependent oxidoreductase [Polaromonas sp.]
VGDIDTVIERVVNEIRTLKPVHYCFQTQMGDFDHPTMLRQLETWAKVIIPTVQQEIANDLPHRPAAQPELATA